MVLTEATRRIPVVLVLSGGSLIPGTSNPTRTQSKVSVTPETLTPCRLIQGIPKVITEPKP